MEERFPAGIEVLPPGPELAALLAVWLPRQRELPCPQSIALDRAVARQCHHYAALRQSSMLAVACRLPGEGKARYAAKPTRSGIAELAQLHGWSEATAKYQAGKAHDIVVRLPVLGETMNKGGMSEDVARAYANATTDFGLSCCNRGQDFMIV